MRNVGPPRSQKQRSTMNPMNARPVKGTHAAALSRQLNTFRGLAVFSVNNCKDYVSVRTWMATDMRKALDTMGYVYTYTEHGGGTAFRVTGKRITK